MKMEQTECSETSAYKIQKLGITQKKTYNIQNTAIVWNQESFLFPKGVSIVHGPQNNSDMYLSRKSTPQRVGRFVNSMSAERTLCSLKDYVLSMTGWLSTAKQGLGSRSKNMQLFLTTAGHHMRM